jgi:LysR family transcriptional regulator, glycine cleavage system transcriptional activator
VGQQIRALEELLGVILFRRTTRGLELTAEAQAALPALRDGFMRFEEAVRTMQAGQAGTMLAMACTRSARGWLLPRLARWQAAAPGIALRLSLIDRAVDFTQANFDLALSFGPSPDAEGVHGRPIAAEALVIVGRADAPAAPIACPEADWERAGVADAPVLTVDHAAAALEAAHAGLGRAMVPATLAADALAAGTLQAHGDPLPISDAFWLCAPAPQWRQAKVRALVASLLTEAVIPAA